MFILFILVGLVSGMMGAMGLGGGTALIPLLSLLSVQQKSAQVINVFSFVIMSFFVLFFNIKNGLTKPFPAIMFSFLGVISAVMFSSLVKEAPTKLLKILFGAFLLCVAVVEIVFFVVKYKKR